MAANDWYRGDALTGDEALSRNDAAYADLLALLGRLQRHPGAIASLTRFAAEFCEFNHTGRFADGALENPLLDLSDQLPRVAGPKLSASPAFARRRVLHIATQVAEVGGHTRTIRQWIEADRESCHSLLLTAQGRSAVPGWLQTAIATAGGDCLILPFPTCPFVRAALARRAAREWSDLVVLHHYGHDVVPIMALAVGGPPVALLNHADHMFWLGGTIADVVVHQRDIGRTLNHRRHIRCDVVLPVPLTEPKSAEPRASVRGRLGIPSDQVMLLSVGRACKYAPTRTHNFFRTAVRILDVHPEAHLYLLGVAREDVAGFDVPAHDRFHFLGPRDTAAEFQRAADVYLEGFPFGSQTALLESALAGTPVVPAFAPPLRLLATSDEALNGLAETPLSDDEYVDRVGELVRSVRIRENMGVALREAVRSSHVGEGWRSRLADVYTITDGLTHTPRQLPLTWCESTPDDLALAEWQAGKSSGAGRATVRIASRDIARQAAYSLRTAGSHGAAFALLRRTIPHFGPDRRLLGDLAKLLPHRALSRAGR